MNCECKINYRLWPDMIVHCPRHSEENVARLEAVIGKTVEQGEPMVAWDTHVEQSKQLATAKAALARLVETAEVMLTSYNSDRITLERTCAMRAAIAAAEEFLK